MKTTMLDIDSLVRKTVSSIKPYKYGDGPKEVAKKLGFSTDEILKLNSNENFLLPENFTNRILREALSELDIRQYPQVLSNDLREDIADFLRLDEVENVFVGNGSDEVMDLLVKIFVDYMRKAIIVEPSFDLYKVYVKTMGGKVVSVLLDHDFKLNVDKVLEIMKRNREKASIMFLASPNNPTANQYPKETVERILEEFGGVVVVDEAYVEFADYTVLDLLRRFENLVILRTFSKAWGAAGLRIGYSIAPTKITSYMTRIVTPFNVNVVSQLVIPRLLANYETIKKSAEKVKEERKYLLERLKNVEGVKCYPSNANFTLIKIIKKGLTGKEVHERLKQKGVLVRDRSHLPLCENCLRVTVGTRRMNAAFLGALEESLNE